MWLGLPCLSLLLHHRLESNGGGDWAATSIALERTGGGAFWSVNIVHWTKRQMPAVPCGHQLDSVG